MQKHSLIRGLLLPALAAVVLPLAAAVGLPMVLAPHGLHPVVLHVAAPDGSREVVLTGTMTGWNEPRMEDPDGDGNYEIAFDLAPGTYEYRIAADGQAVAGRTPDSDANSVLVVPQEATTGD